MPPTLADLTWPFRTERLVVRPATTDDAAAVWRYRSRDEVTEWMSARAGDAETFASYFAERSALGHTLVVELDGRVVGDLKLEVGDAWAQREVADAAEGTQAEIGWAFDPDVQGRGLGTEAARALLRICFDQLGLRRVEAFCFTANSPSWRMMERVGMRREQHTVAESLHRSGEWLDGYGYAMLATEWRTGAGASHAGARDDAQRAR